MDINYIKNYILNNLFDSRGRLCSPKLKLSFFKKDKKVFDFFSNNLSIGISFQESCYRVINNVALVPLCEFCENAVKFYTFKEGFKKTCNQDKCLKKAYGKNPYILTEAQKKTQSARMSLRNPMKNPDTVKKAMETNKERYGDVKPMLREENKLKSLSSRYDAYGTFSPRSKLFKSKDYLLPSGKTVKIQGYESKALDILVKQYGEDSVEICGKSKMFYFYLNGALKRYHPDIFLKEKNLYIEVKSPYTYNIDLAKNEAKKKSVLDSGFNFEFWIFDANSFLTIK